MRRDGNGGGGVRTLAQELAELIDTYGAFHPTDRMGDESLPWAERFDLLDKSHPAAFCRRHLLALVAALEEIDALRDRVARLEAAVPDIFANVGAIAERVGVTPEEATRA